MKKIFLLMALSLSVPGLGAKMRPEPVKLKFTDHPRVFIREDSISTRIYFTVPEEMDKRQLYHKFVVWLVSEQDSTVREKLWSVEATGSRQGRRLHRHKRRAGLTQGKLLKSYSPKKEKQSTLVLSMDIPFEEWMEDGMILRIEQYNAMRMKDPVYTFPTEVYTPSVRDLRSMGEN